MVSERMIAAARAHLGVRFTHQGRHRGEGLDCLGLLLVSAEQVGMAFDGVRAMELDDRAYGARPDTARLERKLATVLRPVHEPQPGDVLLLRVEGRPQHLALVSDYPQALGIIHAYAPARKVIEHRLDAQWRANIHAIFRLPPLT